MALHVDYSALPHVTADLNYLAPTNEKPRTYTYDPPEGTPRSTATPQSHAVAIHNARPLAETLSLDVQGFAILDHRSSVSDFYDDEAVRTTYYPEAEELLRKATGADRVFIFDHTVRRRIPGAEDVRTGPRQPATRVHVDQTAKSGAQRVRDFFPEEADELLRGRVQIVNIWRPIRGPLLDTPLAMCDVRSVDAQDLVPSDLVYRDRIGETYGVTFNPAHEWLYVPQMRTDEALLLKCYDSRTDGRARFLPHTAFVDPTTPADVPPRESIELRTLVFHSH